MCFIEMRCPIQTGGSKIYVSIRQAEVPDRSWIFPSSRTPQTLQGIEVRAEVTPEKRRQEIHHFSQMITCCPHSLR